MQPRLHSAALKFAEYVQPHPQALSRGMLLRTCIRTLKLRLIPSLEVSYLSKKEEKNSFLHICRHLTEIL